MSTVKAINLQHPASANPNLILTGGGAIGVGNTSPLGKLTVQSGGVDGIVLEKDTNATGNSNRLIFMQDGTNFAMCATSNTLSMFSGSTPGNSTGTQRVSLSSAGYLNIYNQPMCSVTHNASVAYGAGALIQWSSYYDPLSMFSGASNYRITVPISGRYLVSASLLLNSNSTGPLSVYVRKNGVNIRRFYSNQSYGYQSGSITFIMNCAANDYIDCVTEVAQNIYGNDIGDLCVTLLG